MQFTRRRLFFFGSASIIAAGIASLSTLDGYRSSARIVRRKLKYLTFSSDAPEAFERALKEHSQQASPIPQQIRKDASHYLARLRQSPLRTMAAYEERVCTQFLLSTDFFQNGADVRKPVQFVALADPYTSPCGNPIARIA